MYLKRDRRQGFGSCNTNNLCDPNVDYITSLLAANPTLYRDELQNQIQAARGIRPSVSTIYRALHH